MKFILLFFLFLLVCFFVSYLKLRDSRTSEWWKGDRSSAGLAPLPQDEPGAVVQVYGARTVSWHGYAAVHTWISVKKKNASSYQTFQVIGYRLMRGLGVVAIQDALPDTKWFGNSPELLRDLRGPAAESAIPKIEAAALSYPYPNAYRAWPGPNSNTFVSHIIRQTPEIGIELPPNAIGKDWLENGSLFAISETRTGIQFSVLGVFGFIVGLGEGIEFNILAMTFGFDFLRPALKLPFLGRIGLQDSPVFQDSKNLEPPLEQEITQPMVKKKK